jgi:hypothetical protein
MRLCKYVITAAVASHCLPHCSITPIFFLNPPLFLDIFRLLFGLPLFLLSTDIFFDRYFSPHFQCPHHVSLLQSIVSINRSFHFHAPQYSVQTWRLQQTEGEFVAPQNLYTVAEEANPGPRWANIPSRQKIISLLNCLVFCTQYLFQVIDFHTGLENRN